MQQVIEAIERLYQRAHDNVKAIVTDGDRITLDSVVLAEVTVTGNETGNRYEDLAAIRPGLIVVSVSCYGKTGPYADRAGNVARRTEDGWQTREGGQWSRDSIPPGTLEQAQAADRARPATRDRPTATRPAPETRPATRPAAQPSTRPATQPTTRPATQPSTRPATRPATPSRDIDRASLDRAHAARQHGANRQMARPSGTNRPQRRR